MALTLLSGAMDNPDDTRYRRRQGFWLRMAREAAGKKQEAAAKHIGLKTKSAISDYENGVTPVPMAALRRLADYYGWALVIFTEPDLDAEEQAQERMARLARAAIRVAARDEAPVGEPGVRSDDASPDAQPDRRLA